jgi:hypothetical protein
LIDNQHRNRFVPNFCIFENFIPFPSFQIDLVPDEYAKHRLLVELSVVEQCLNIHKTGVVQRKRVESFNSGAPFVFPRVHGMVFDPSVGILNKLKISYQHQLQEFQHIYNLVPDESRSSIPKD